MRYIFTDDALAPVMFAWLMSARYLSPMLKLGLDALTHDHHDDFYVEPGCCMLCGVPEAIAPDLFHTGNDHCSIIRQPCSTQELDQMIHAMWAGEVDCVRYRGRDEEFVVRMAQAGMVGQTDYPSTSDIPVVFRDRVYFRLPQAIGIQTAEQVAHAFREDMRADQCKVLPPIFGRRSAWISWFRSRFHLIRFGRHDDGQFVAVIRSANAVQGLAWRIHEWLQTHSADNIIWQAGHTSSTARDTPM